MVYGPKTTYLRCAKGKTLATITNPVVVITIATIVSAAINVVVINELDELRSQWC